MSKNKTRLIIVLTALVTIISTLCYAEPGTNDVENLSAGDMARTVTEPVVDESIPVTTAEDPQAPVTIVEDEHTHEETNGEETSGTEEAIIPNLEPTVHDGDLYLIGSDIVMDKLVDGNVFLIGRNITVTGQTSGNMFIIGENVTLDKSFITSSAFIIGKKVQFNAVSSSLYCIADELSIDSQFGVYLDLYATCKTFNCSGLVGRDTYLTANTMNFGDTATFYGDFNYTSNSEIEIPENLVAGDVIFSKTIEEDKNQTSMISYISDLIQTLMFITVLFFIIKIFTKDPESKEYSTLSHPFKTFGVGILSIPLIFIAILVLMLSIIGLSAGLLGLYVYILLLVFAQFIFTISLARHLCIGKKHKGIKQFLFTVLFTIILWALSLIPFIGIITNIIVIIMGFGIFIYTPLRKKARCTNKEKKKIKNTKDESPVKDSQKSEDITPVKESEEKTDTTTDEESEEK